MLSWIAIQASRLLALVAAKLLLWAIKRNARADGVDV